ncbi:50S ribosomal protein L23 [Patescibacteria group bacterium]|nr:50S ribosomal protein L23 [Patescibacteria group bacterium]
MSIIKNVFKKEKKAESKGAAEKSQQLAKPTKSSLASKKIKKKGGSDKKKTARIDSGAYRALVQPLISEKATFLSGENKYVFGVNRQATKREIKQAIKDVYGVEPSGVNVISVKGKSRRYGRTLGRTNDHKKAIVTLPAGQSIQVYEGV